MSGPGTGVRIGVDVGGTFTKAVAVDLAEGRLVAESVIPTTHDAPEGVAHGVVRAVRDVAEAVGPESVELVSHSTTQAVNALLEGDVHEVGVIGMGRRPDLAKVRKRTELRDVELSPGRSLRTRPVFFDVTDGLVPDAVAAELDTMQRGGIEAVAVAEAFSPDDDTNEATVAGLARERGMAACASTELSGLYGLELRTVTAAINASILPIAVRTAGYVEDGVRGAGITAPLMVMRGDGGATDLDGFRGAPARTLYSGPAASVAGALRHGGIDDGVIVEVGGTSTNVAAVRDGRPALSYVRVASHATAIRSVDVRVVGVAGGSMLRVSTRSRRRRVHGVGPRSAHIAGLRYAAFCDIDELDGAEAVTVAPRPGDPDDHLVLRLRTGELLALTNTCAANALGLPRPGDYAYADPSAATRAFEIAGEWLGWQGAEVARAMLTASGEAVCELVSALVATQKLRDPTIVSVGGGAGGLGRHVAAMLGLECRIPDRAEVISSIGDALSHIRAERERTVEAVDAALVTELVADVEAEAVAAGASHESLDVRVEEQPERGTVRAVATGTVALTTGALPGRGAATEAEIRERAGTDDVTQVGAFWLCRRRRRLLLLDRYGDRVVSLSGEVAEWDDLESTYHRLTRHRGPVTLRPTVWVVEGRRLTELSSGEPTTAALALRGDHPGAPQLLLVGRSD